MAGCELSICDKNYKNKRCACYPNLSVLNNMVIDDKNEAVRANQICAHESKGFLYPCDPGCCQGGCPGQCLDVPPRPPQKVYTPQEVTPSVSSSNLFKLWATLTVFFLYISIL